MRKHTNAAAGLIAWLAAVLLIAPAPAAWAAEPRGTIVLPARAAELDAVGKGIAFNNPTSRVYIGSWKSTESSARWQVDYPSRAAYRVILVAGCDATNAGSTVQVDTAGQTATGTIPSSGAWGQFVDVDLGPVLVRRPGVTSLVVRATTIARFAAMNLKAVKLVPEP